MNLPICIPSGTDVALYYQDGRSWLGESLSKGVVLSNRMLVVIRGQSTGLISLWTDRNLKELVAANHPGNLENLALSKLKIGRGLILVVVMDRRLLGELRNLVGSGVPLMVPVPRATAELSHPDGARERISFTKKDGYQFHYFSKDSQEDGRVAGAPKSKDLWEVFPDSRRRRRRALLFGFSLFLSLLIALPLAVLPWRSLRRAQISRSQAGLELQQSVLANDERGRQMAVLEEEYRHLLALRGARSSSLFHLLEEIYSFSPGAVGVEELSLEGGTFHVVLWTYLPDSLIQGLEESERVSVANVMERGTQEDGGTPLRKLSISGRLNE